MADAPALTALLPAHGPLPASSDESALVDAYLRDAPVRADGLTVRANMVVSLDGAVAGDSGLSGEISSDADKRVFSVLRSLACAVVVGAGTARAERYTRLSAKPRHAAQRAARGQEPVPDLVLITRSGRVEVDRLLEAGSSPVVVHTLCEDEAVLAPIREAFGPDSVVVHAREIAPEAVLADLRRRGRREILCEGGPELLGTWVAAGAVDELCLTTSTLLAGASGSDADDGAGAEAPAGLLGSARLPQPVGVTPTSLIAGDGALIGRWRIVRD